MTNVVAENSSALAVELNWLAKVIEARLSQTRRHDERRLVSEEIAIRNRIPYAHEATDFALVRGIAPPKHKAQASTLVSFLIEEQIGVPERILLNLCLANHVMPDLLSSFFTSALDGRILRAEFGGTKGSNFRFFVPTGLTYVYIMGGYNVADRLRAQMMFSSEHLFFERGILSLEPHFKGDPSVSGKLAIAESWLDYFTFGLRETPFRSLKYAHIHHNDTPNENRQDDTQSA